MVGPPGLPIVMKNFPSLRTMVGVIEESGRLPAATAFAAAPSMPYWFGAPALAEKLSMLLFQRNPAPAATAPMP
jgi:hypothetical protein